MKKKRNIGSIEEGEKGKNKVAYISVVWLLMIIFLTVFSVFVTAQASLSAADDALERARNAINFMESNNLSTERVLDLLDEAKLHFDEREFDEVIEIEKEIRLLKNLSFILHDRIHDVEIRISQAKHVGYNSSNASLALYQSKESFFIGNYEHAQSTLRTAENIIADFLLQELKQMHSIVKDLANRSSILGISLGDTILGEVETAIESTETSIEVSARTKKEIEENGGNSIDGLYDRVLALNSSIQLIEAAYTAKSIHNVTRIQDSYNEALIALELELFEKSIARANEIVELGKEIEQLETDISNVKVQLHRLMQKGVAVAEAEVLFASAIMEFEEEDYEVSRELLLQTQEEIEMIETRSILTSILLKEKTGDALQFVKKFWYIFILAFIVLIVVSVVLYKLLQKQWLVYELSSFKKEEPALIELIKKDQTEYFKEKTMSKETYENRMDKHHERLLYIRESIPKLQKKVNKIKKE